GDELRWGSKICTAPAGDLGNWTCRGDPKKYDSPLVFRHHQDVYLIGRRNVTPSGNYDLHRDDLSAADQTSTYEVEYSFEPKRCSLWRVDPQALSVSFVLDLPSRGDTCFASILKRSDKDYAVYNYTSSLEGGNDPSWIAAQGQPTLIYRAILSFP